MLQFVKLNVLIPLEYNKAEYEKSAEPSLEVTAKQANSEKSADNDNSNIWFHYCFRSKPIEKNFQNVNSPIVNDMNYKISRIELNSVLRSTVGLHQNENAAYYLKNSDHCFRIGKIRILFTKSRIAFAHFEILASDLSNDEARLLFHAFSKITSSQPQIFYKKKISRNEEETIQITMKDLIQNVIDLQSYIPLSIYKDRITPFFQICMIGNCEAEDKRLFFDSIRTLSRRTSSRPVDEVFMYAGSDDYISRFVGDKTVCIFGDTALCGDTNLSFLTDVGNGLIKSATENYLTAYAFLVSLHLLANENDSTDPDIEYLINAPSRLSDEDNIREFYEKCIWNEGWNLSGRMPLPEIIFKERMMSIRKKKSTGSAPGWSYMIRN